MDPAGYKTRSLVLATAFLINATPVYADASEAAEDGAIETVIVTATPLSYHRMTFQCQIYLDT